MDKEDRMISIRKYNKKGITVIDNIRYFDLIATLKSGQTFRYFEVQNGAVVINKNIATYMEMKDNKFVVHTVDNSIVSMWIEYFNLKTDYDKINKDLLKADKRMKEMIANGKGVRVIKQDEWESIITFIISANNNMSRIKSGINQIAKTYGKKIGNVLGIECYSLPDPKLISKLKPEDLRKLGVGFRDKYIIDAANKIVDKTIDFEYMHKSNGMVVKQELLKVNGIGSKVADCIRLFAFNKFDSFPVDVWIERIMLEIFLDNGKYTKKEIEEYGLKIFKEYAGYAQQYIFYYCITAYKDNQKLEKSKSKNQKVKIENEKQKINKNQN